MTDPVYETVEQLLERARDLFGQADDHWRLVHDPRARDLAQTDLTVQDHLDRMVAVGAHATTAARIAHAMNGVDHLAMLREYEARLDERAEGLRGAVDRLVAAENRRVPYEPPTLTGSHDADDRDRESVTPPIQAEPSPSSRRVALNDPDVARWPELTDPDGH